MTAPQIIQAGEYNYRVVLDDPAIPFEPYRVIVRGVALDETSLHPPRAALSVLPDQPFARGKTLADGLFCLAGYAGQVIPDHANTAHLLTYTLRAPGYQDQSLSINVLAGAILPVTAPTVSLRRTPIRLMGRVTTDDTARTPIVGASVISVIDPDAFLPSEYIFLLRSPMRFNHTTGASVQQRALNSAGVTPVLNAAARAGTTTLVVSNRQGLAANQILQIAPERLGELVMLSNVSTTPANLTQPGEITLQTGLAHSFEAGASVQAFTKGALSGVPRQLTRNAFVGDGVLLANGEVPIGILEITDGLQTELVVVGALTDADGIYRFDGVGRVAQVFLEFSASGFTTPAKPTPWDINYETHVNIVDCQLSP